MVAGHPCLNLTCFGGPLAGVERRVKRLLETYLV